MNTKSNNMTQYCMKMKPSFGRVWHNESGAALIVALLLMVAMISIIPVAMHMTSSELKRTGGFKDSREAFFTADAGMQHAGALYQAYSSNVLLKGPDGDLTSTTDNGTFTDSGSLGFIISGSSQATYTSAIDDTAHTYTEVSLDGHKYFIRIWDNDDSALCPTSCAVGHADPNLDTDNEDWVDRDGMVEVESVGIVYESDGATVKEMVTLRGLLKRKFTPAYGIPGAVVLVGPRAEMLIRGTSGVAGANNSGKGFGINGVADSDCAGTRGIALEAENTGGGADYTDVDTPAAGEMDTCSNGNNACLGWQPANLKRNIDGTMETANDPDIYAGQTDFTALDAEKLWDDMVVNNTPDQVLASGASGDITNWGTYDDPVVIHVTGDFSPSGNDTGYGVLVVDGNLDMGGTLEWNGILIISGCDDCEGILSGNGTLRTSGTVIIGNDGNEAAPPFKDTISKSTFSGTLDYNFSCEGIDIANGAFKDSFAVVTWNEVTP